MKYEVTEVNPPRQAWIVTRARTLKGLPPLECEIVAHTIDNQPDAGESSLVCVIAKVGKRKRAFMTRDVACDEKMARMLTDSLLRHEELALVVRKTNNGLTELATKKTIARDAKRIDDARQKLAAAPNKADE